MPADVDARLQVSLEVCLNRDGDRIGTGRVDEVDQHRDAVIVNAVGVKRQLPREVGVLAPDRRV